jgi:GH15 family glucan-1,4-alpha-glucosidase
MATAMDRVDGYAPLRGYAAIGNKRTVALVALDGSIDWMPHPTLEGPTVFAALLDPGRGGRFGLAPAAPYAAERRYLPGTNVLETTFTTAGGVARVTDAMSRPIAHTLVFNQIIRGVEGVAGAVELAWSVEPRFDYGQAGVPPVAHDGAALFAHGPDVVALQAFGGGAPEPAGHGVRGRFTAREGDVAVLALSAFRDEPLSLETREHMLGRLDATAERWRRWSAECAYDGPWRDAVLRSALALDLLVDDQTGAIAAAATLGLPEQIGGERNFDYRYAWLRDANLTLEAMLRLGYRDQVHTSLGWMLRAVRRTHPRLRPVYRLDGRPRLPDAELPLAGYRGSRPLPVGNPAQSQLQLGNYGDVFDMTAQYLDDGNALPPDAREQLAELADFVCRIWGQRDAGIWELDEHRHYTQSKLACWLSLDRALALAGRGALPDDRAGAWRRERGRIERFLAERCWSPERRAYTRAAGSDELDAGVLLASRGSFLEDQPERFNATIDAIRGELGAGGPLLYRYSGMQDEEGAFVACSFWLVEALARAGRVDEAAATMDEMVGQVNDVGLFCEEIDPGGGGFLGNLPQALSHLALVNAAERIRRSAAGRRARRAPAAAAAAGSPRS